MKSIVTKVLTSLTVCLATTASAQGTVNFANNQATLVQWVYGLDDHTPKPMMPGNGFVQFLWAAAGTPFTSYNGGVPSDWLKLNPGWSLSQASITAIGPNPGMFSGGTLNLATITPGAAIDGVVTCWFGPYQTLDEAMVSGSAFGFSDRFTLTTGSSSGSATDLTAPGGFTGMTFPLEIPEPTVWALSLLGVLCFWVKAVCPRP